jgi:hypothetical protein
MLRSRVDLEMRVKVRLESDYLGSGVLCQGVRLEVYMVGQLCVLGSSLSCSIVQDTEKVGSHMEDRCWS